MQRGDRAQTDNKYMADQELLGALDEYALIVHTKGIGMAERAFPDIAERLRGDDDPKTKILLTRLLTFYEEDTNLDF